MVEQSCGVLKVVVEEIHVVKQNYADQSMVNHVVFAMVETQARRARTSTSIAVSEIVEHYENLAWPNE